MEEEIWKDVVGYDGLYKVSNYGRIKNNNKILKTNNSNGYRRITISKLGKGKCFYIHILVCRAFIGIKPDRHIVNHIDGNRVNNNILNLEYATLQNNALHSCQILGKNSMKLTAENVLEIIYLYNSRNLNQEQLAEKFNVRSQTISDIVTGNGWSSVSGIKHVKNLFFLTEKQIGEIKILRTYGLTQQAIADKIGCGRTSVGQVLAGKTYKNNSKLLTIKCPSTIDLSEIFKDIQGYESLYKVSNFGRVFGCKYGKILKPKNEHGYLRVSLSKNGRIKYIRIHQLVSMVFIGDKPIGCVVNHIDGNRSNNHISNLEYITPSSNSMHSSYTLRHGNIKLDEEIVFNIIRLRETCLLQEISDKLNIPLGTINNVLSGKSWRNITGIKYERSNRKITTKSQVIQIMDMYNLGEYSKKEISDYVGVNVDIVRCIVSGRTWSYITGIHNASN